MKSEQEKGRAMSEELAHKIGQLLGEHDGAVVVKWLALIEVVDSDGERAFWALHPDGLKPWDTLGMLVFARDLEAAGTIHPWGRD